MLTFLFFLIWIINICLSVKKMNNKYVMIVSFIFLIVLFCGSTMNSDYFYYNRAYTSGDLSIYDYGYQIVGYICMQLKLSYNLFVATLIVPCYLLLFYVVYKMKSNIHLFISMYLAFLVFYDINQIRNFIVAVLLTYAIYALSQKRSILFLVTIVIASLFHSIALFYIPLIFINKITINKQTLKYLSIYAIFSIVMIKIIVSQSDIIGKIIQLFSNNEEVIMYGISQINFGFLIPVFYFIFNVILVYFSIRILKDINKYIENERFIKICEFTLIISMVFLPLLTVNLTFDRIFRNFSFIYYILAGIVLNELFADKKKNKKTIALFISFLMIFSIVWSMGTVYRYNGFGNTEYKKILDNNLFFD